MGTQGKIGLNLVLSFDICDHCFADCSSTPQQTALHHAQMSNDNDKIRPHCFPPRYLQEKLMN
jgi:hypothetical protein